MTSGPVSNRQRYGITTLRTVQMTLDEELVSAIDRVAETQGTSRSGFARQALRDALARLSESPRGRTAESRFGGVRSMPEGQ